MSFLSAGRFGAEAILSSTGAPVVSTPVTVYLSGTVTPASLYTDNTMGTAATNPVNTDGVGNLSFYAAPGIYDLSFVVGGVTTVQTVIVDPWPADVGLLNTQIALLGAGGYLAGGGGPGIGQPSKGLQVGTDIFVVNGGGLAQLALPVTYTHGIRAAGVTIAEPFALMPAINPSSSTTGLLGVNFYNAAGTIVTSVNVTASWWTIGD